MMIGKKSLKREAISEQHSQDLGRIIGVIISKIINMWTHISVIFSHQSWSKPFLVDTFYLFTC